MKAATAPAPKTAERFYAAASAKEKA